MSMHVLHVISSLEKTAGGPSHMLASLCDALAGVGIRVTLAAKDSLNDEKCVIPRHPSISKIQISSRGGENFLKAYCEMEEVNCIHNHGLWMITNHLAAVVSKKCGLPLITTTHGMLRPWARTHKRWKKNLAWWLYQSADIRTARVLHATCKEEAMEMACYGIHNPVAEIPIGIDLITSKPRPLIASGKRNLLFMGRMHPVKGLMNMVAAMDRVRPKEWHCLIAGPDVNGYRPILEEEIHRRELGDWFTFTGQVSGDAKMALFHQSELFVLPSYTENFGVVVLEALASGVPVLTTNAAPWGRLPEVGCGWSIPVGADELAETLAKCFSMTGDELRAMGRKGRKWVENEFTWGSIAQHMKSVYDWCVNGGEPPECVRFN